MNGTLLVSLNDLENEIKFCNYDSASPFIRRIIRHFIKRAGTTKAYYDLWHEHVSSKDVSNLRGEDFDDQSCVLFVPYKSLLYRALKLSKPDFAKHIDSYYPTKTGFYYIHFLNHEHSDYLLDLVKSPKHLLDFVNGHIGAN